MLCGANKITNGKVRWKKCIDVFYNYKVPLLHEWLQSALRKWHQNWRQSAVISKGYSTRRIYAFFSAGDVWWRMKSDSAASAVSTFHCVTACSVVMQRRLFLIPKRPKDGQRILIAESTHFTLHSCLLERFYVQITVKVTFLNQKDNPDSRIRKQ